MIEENKHYTSCSISRHQCQCFEKLTDEEKKLIENKSVIIKYKKGEIICKQGGLASHIMYMQRGLAKVFLDNGVNSLVLKIIPNENFLGLASVSAEFQTFQYSAMAYIDSEIKQIEVSAFNHILKNNSDFAKEIINILSANSVQIYGRFFCLTNKQSYGRVADILLCIADRIFKTSEFELPLSRQDLAELTGMSSETVIRILKKLREEGLIEIKGKVLKILNYEQLQRISETG